ncbi:MFS transporter [Nodosilinea sp. PGN35]|uniref:MFS transporter n=1 Tax=Nodosilinea sp. PGN35 TaxID=3020489 RepID=UPI0023B26DD4|nr:MFS transporter [Nodosilinea sp. TSF1-S3]MDF0368754.1 MFS transporter [Nodosilinea sp. TSF1-S3]
MEKPAAQSILWGPVWGLALMQGAITLLWVIYNLYLVELLTRLGFSQGLAVGLLVVENLLAMVVEPLMGTFSDQMQHKIGTRLPLVSLGVVLAAGLFVVIPTTLVWGQGALRWGLPLLLVAWALAMAVFRSPALSLLGRYAMGTQLPQAASILTLVGGVSGAMGPLAGQFILGMGPFVAFALGSVVLLVATLALRWAGPRGPIDSAPGDGAAANPTSIPLPWASLGLIFGTGVGVGLGFRLVMTALPATLTQRVPNANIPLVLGALFIALALTAIPAGQLARRLGNRRAMVVGLSAMACLAILVGAIASTAVGMLLAALFGAALSLVSNGTLPFALNMVPPARAGLGTGTYFSGGALAASVGGGLFSNSGLAPTVIALVAALAFLVAGLCVGASGQLSRRVTREV